MAKPRISTCASKNRSADRRALYVIARSRWRCTPAFSGEEPRLTTVADQKTPACEDHRGEGHAQHITLVADCRRSQAVRRENTL